MNRQLGPHFMGNPDIDTIVPIVNRWRPAAIKWLGDAKKMLELYNQIDYSPKPKMVWRTWWQNHRGTPDSFVWFEEKPARVAYGEWLQCVGTINLQTIRDQPDFYVEGFNEIPLSSRKFVEFEAYRTGQLNEMWGLKTAALCFSVGQDLPIDMLIDSGLMTMLAGTGGVIDGHYYFDGLGPQIWHGDAQSVSQTDRHLPHPPGWYLENEKFYPPEMENTYLGFRMARHYGEFKRHGFHNVKIINSEAGCDHCLDKEGETYRIYSEGKHGRGWRTWEPIWREMGLLKDKTAAQLFAEMLWYAERQYRQYSDFLLGNTIFTWGGHGDWEQARVEPEVVDELLKIYDKEDDMTNEEPVMPDEPTVIIQPTSDFIMPYERLHVPHVSQTAPNWPKGYDCGPSSGAMLIEAYTGKAVDSATLYKIIGKTDDTYWSAHQVAMLLRAHNIESEWRIGLTIGEVFNYIYQQKPMIVLMNYGALKQQGYESPSIFNGAHFMVIVGMTSREIIFLDPLADKVQSITIDKWWSAWNENDKHNNPNCSAIIPTIGLHEFEREKPEMYRVRVTAYPYLNIRSKPKVSPTTQLRGEALRPGDVVIIYAEQDENGNRWGAIAPDKTRWIAMKYNGNEYAKRIE